MPDQHPNHPRRQFLKIGGLGLATLFLADKTLAQKSAAQAGAAKLEMTKETDPQATALGYKEDAAKVDVKKWPKRGGAEGSKQFCYNCQFYQSKSDKPASVPAAPCTLFANKGVTAKGWCNGWVQNPTVKG